MALTRLALAVLFNLAAGALPLAAANLIENGTFDDDVEHWKAAGASTIQHSTADELGSPTSGSLLLTATALDQNTMRATQCVPVVENTTYVYGAAARLSETQPGNAAFVRAEWFSTPDCDGSQIDIDSALPFFMGLKGPWGPTQKWETAPPTAQSALLVLNANNAGEPQTTLFQAEFDNVFFVDNATCGRTATVLCLNDNRFRVIVKWTTQDGTDGFGRAVPLTVDSGYFWFFNEANVELVTKSINACPSPAYDHFWFFAAGLTDVQVIMHVHDTVADVERMYVNAIHNPFAPIQDTLAFDTCP